MGGVSFNGTQKDVYILQNYIHNDISSFNGNVSTNIFIFNNIIGTDVRFSADDNSIYLINNIVNARRVNGNFSMSIHSSIVRNNIFLGTYFSLNLNASNSIVQRNLAERVGFFDLTLHPLNMEGTPHTDILTYNGATDEQYQLLVGGANINPAIGYGHYGGEDIGAFDVPNDPSFTNYAPFEIGCLPPIPAIYECNVIQNSGNLDVTISTRSKN